MFFQKKRKKTFQKEKKKEEEKRYTRGKIKEIRRKKLYSLIS